MSTTNEASSDRSQELIKRRLELEKAELHRPTMEANLKLDQASETLKTWEMKNAKHFFQHPEGIELAREIIKAYDRHKVLGDRYTAIENNLKD